MNLYVPFRNKVIFSERSYQSKSKTKYESKCGDEESSNTSHYSDFTSKNELAQLLTFPSRSKIPGTLKLDRKSDKPLQKIKHPPYSV